MLANLLAGLAGAQGNASMYAVRKTRKMQELAKPVDESKRAHSAKSSVHAVSGQWLLSSTDAF